MQVQGQEHNKRTRAPVTLYVGEDQSYSSIQAAINEAEPGDAVFVFNGSYIEDLVIEKRIKLQGEDPNTTIINGSGLDDTIHVKSSGVTLSGFTVICNGSEWYDACIEINDANNCSLTDIRFNSAQNGLFLSHAINTEIFGNEFLGNNYGIFSQFSKNNKISNNSFMLNEVGIYLEGSVVNVIDHNNVLANEIGIHLYLQSNNNIISNNSIQSNSESGLSVSRYCENNSAIQNNISDNQYAIYHSDSSYTIIKNNSCPGNHMGFVISNSKTLFIENNTLECSNHNFNIRASVDINLENNTMKGLGIILNVNFDEYYYWDPGYYWYDMSLRFWNSHSISQSNILNGKPIYYWRNRKNGTIPTGGAQIILANCTNVTVANQNISNIDSPIHLGGSNRIKIVNNTIFNCTNGIYSVGDNNLIINNNISNNHYGIRLDTGSFNNTIKNNTIESNYEGINCRFYLYNNSIVQNTFSNNTFGLIFYENYYNNSITDNKFISNNYYGIYISASRDLYISNNSFTDDGIVLNGYYSTHWSSHSIDSSNVINGKPIIYWANRVGGMVPDGAGQVFLVNCSGVSIENQNLNSALTGITLSYSTDIYIANNTISKNRVNGIEIISSLNNTIINNEISNNSGFGLFFYGGWWWYDRIGSDNNSVIANTISGNGNSGIYIGQGSNITIKGNVISNNTHNGINLAANQDRNVGGKISENQIIRNFENGIEIYNLNDITIRNNTIAFNNHSGLEIRDFTGIIENNLIHTNNECGLKITSSYWCMIANNKFNNNQYGIQIWHSMSHTVIYNLIVNNGYGIELISSSENKIYYNNFIGNTIQVKDDSLNSWTNTWNNIYPFGGNYWSDYYGSDEYSGVDQDVPGADGFGDSPYLIKAGGENTYDQYPFIYVVQDSLDNRSYYNLTPWQVQNLTATGSSGYVLLTWERPEFVGRSRVFGYKIYRGNAPGKGKIVAELEIYKEVDLRWVDLNVTWGEKYYYKIAAENGFGTGPNVSVEVNVTEPNFDPSSDSEDVLGLEGGLISVLILLIIIILIVLMILTTRRSRKKKAIHQKNGKKESRAMVSETEQTESKDQSLQTKQTPPGQGTEQDEESFF
jgi:parallel beta-helix repeat protein